MQLTGRCAIITGANQGLGFEIAKHFVAAGADVMLCARNFAKLKECQKILSEFASPDAKILIRATDVSKLDDVEHLVADTLLQLGHIDILVANAGVYGTKGPIEEIDWQEWSDSIDINLKGTVLQCRAVIPYFKKMRRGKIIVLSGGGATKPMPFLSAYAASKAAVVRFAETLSEEVKDFCIDVNTVAPGALNTRLLDEILEAGPEKVGTHFYEQSLKQQSQGGTPLSAGASLCVYLASGESDGITGKLISAVWDPWETFQTYIEDLKNTDIYTLRRITPADRDKAWGDK
jgi:NAD(P)-dependent dehydrogenase (short-subunit alcohol dehydrogenase family)